MSTTQRSCDALAAFADLETDLFCDAASSSRSVVAFIRDVRANTPAPAANGRAFLPRPPVSGSAARDLCETVLLRAA